MRTLGDIVKEALEARGISQGQAVMKTGISQSAINNIIHGRRKAVRPDILVALAEGLDLDPVELLYAAAGKEPPDRPTRPLPPHLAALVELVGDDEIRELARALRKLPEEKRQAVFSALWSVIEALE
ncbi:MAG: helix-turn-helix transcriptional regulator [Armatimonadetes bacterium]|nr:helix-turn-helix transcriptional regulator [Armatimonadota bacterium]